MKKLEDKILKKIKNGEVKMKPKWRFEVEKKSIVGIWVMTLIAAAIFILMVAIFVETYQPFEILKYGEVGRQLLAEDFPYWWLLSGVGLMVVGVMLDQRIGDNYKKSTVNQLMIVVAGVILLSILFRLLAF